MTTTTEPTSQERSDVKSQQGRLSRLMQFELTATKIKRQELMHFSRQLAVFIRAGIPIIDALETIASEVTNKFFKEVLDDAAGNLRAGTTFAGAIEPHEDAFPSYYLGILRSAELTGRLDQALNNLADYIERDVEARRKVVNALTYPAIVAAMAVAVVIILVAFVLPRFKVFFEQLDAKLPLPTRMLLAFTDFTQRYWYLFALWAVLLLGLAVWMTRSDRGKAIRDQLILKTPVLGDLVRTAILERFCRILSSMTSAGVPLPEGLRVTAQASSNSVYREGILSAREAMMRGEGLAGPLGDTGLFPSAAKQMLRVGEDTGSLDEQLGTAAEYFDRDLEYKIKRFTSLFEPAVILIVGLVVGFVAVALVSAMYGIFNQVHP